jgi:hypothetical protein
MRVRSAWVLFTLAVVIAACGGGSKSGIVPAPGSNSGSQNGNAPASSKTTHASVSLYVPPPNKQNARSRPLYIPGNTQSFGVFVEPYPSSVPSIGPSSIPPAGIQVFPIATPSPCVVPSGGGYECTLTVTANIGTDLFVVVAFAGASPSPSAVPLSAYLSGPVTISLSPAPGATPLAFTLNGVVNSVAVTVPIPDPSNTPNTQVFTALVPTTAPLAITALDSSGNMVMSPATLPFFNPVDIQASPASDGVTLSLIGSSVCGSTASGATAQVNCTGDLGDVQVFYDGSTHPDSNDHAIDTFKVYSTNAPNPTPSPATFVLASNVVTYPINDGGAYVSGGSLLTLSTGQLLYLFDASSPEIGTFTPSNTTITTPVTLNGTSYIYSIAVAPNGTFWAADSGSILDCWSSVSSALGGTAPTTYTPYSPNEDALDFEAVTVDSANNVWFAGDDATSNDYAGYVSAASGCPASGTTVLATYALSGDASDESPYAAPLANGMVYNSYDSGMYEVTTSGASAAATPALGSGSYGAGAATDPAGNGYGAFLNYNTETADIESLASGSLNSLVMLLPTTAIDNLYPSPSGLAVFSGTGGTADRASYPDRYLNGEGFVESLRTTPATLISALPNASSLFQTAYGPTGAAYILYETYNGSSEGLAIARTVNTTTWSVPVSTVTGGGCNDGAMMSINERGDSGPFSVTASPAANVTITAMPGTDHDYLITPTGETSSATVQLTVTDKNGRTWVVPSFTATQGSSSC